MDFQSKSKLRKALLEKRGALDPDRGHDLLERLQFELHEFTHVASFIPFGSEIDISPINEWILEVKQLYIPRNTDFHHITSYDDLEMHPFGFEQPKAECLHAKNVECFLVPGVAFDLKNNRLGYGHGHIDRTLAKYPNVRTIGINYREMVIEELPVEEHDVALHQIIHD